jgi:cation:H+ antiporter
MIQSNLLLWFGILAVAVFATHWGAEQLTKQLKKLRKQWGLTQIAGGALIGLAAASPEIGINITSASRGVADIGLGVMLGSNIVAIPLMMTIAYAASRSASLGSGDEQGETQEEHEQHREEHLLRVKREAVSLLAGPYIGILLLVAALTVPAGWRGLQPVDGVVMGIAYLVFLAQAVVRGRTESEEVEWKRKELALAGAGFVVLALGAYFTVRATENIISALGISRIVGGLFITAIMATTPEIFATWKVVRSGQVTAGTTSVIGDHAVTMTVAFIPLALVTVPVQNVQLYIVNIIFVILMPVTYAVLIHVGEHEHGFERWEVGALDLLYVLYVAIIAFWVLNIV